MVNAVLLPLVHTVALVMVGATYVGAATPDTAKTNALLLAVTTEEVVLAK